MITSLTSASIVAADAASSSASRGAPRDVHAVALAGEDHLDQPAHALLVLARRGSVSLPASGRSARSSTRSGATAAVAAGRQVDAGTSCPSPGSEYSDTRPPDWLTIPCTVASPRPVPWPGSLVVKNGSKTRSAIVARHPDAGVGERQT